MLFFFSISNIIKTNENELILTWLEKNPKKFNLLMNANINGDSNSIFYEKCGKNTKLWILYQPLMDDGYRSGGNKSEILPKSSYIC